MVLRNIHIWKLWLAALIAGGLVAAMAYSSHLELSASAAGTNISGGTAVTARPAPAKPAVSAPVVSSGTPVEPAVKIPSPQSCTPDTAYNLPAPIDLASRPDGLSLVNDSTAYYTVYGNTAGQIETEVWRCAPKLNSSRNDMDEFAAETGYNLSASYQWAAGSDDHCRVSEVKVGLHINMVMPHWQPTAYSAGGLAEAWQTYISDLTVHETGHVSIDKQYADQLLTDLQTFPPTDCSTIANGLNAKVNADIAALNAANGAYDASTDHGATQGAVLP